MAPTDDARTETQLDVLVAEMVASYVRSGGVWGGEVVVSLRVTVELESGETRRTVHRRRMPTQSTDMPLTAQQQRIVNTLAASPKPMKRLTLAHAMGLKIMGGTHGQSVSRLRDMGVIFVRDGLVTDDETKFEDTT